MELALPEIDQMIEDEDEEESDLEDGAVKVNQGDFEENVLRVKRALSRKSS